MNLKERISLILGKGTTQNDITLYKGEKVVRNATFPDTTGVRQYTRHCSVDNDIQMMITNGQPAEEEIKKAAIRNGMKPIMHGGLRESS